MAGGAVRDEPTDAAARFTVILGDVWSIHPDRFPVRFPCTKIILLAGEKDRPEELGRHWKISITNMTRRESSIIVEISRPFDATP